MRGRAAEWGGTEAMGRVARGRGKDGHMVGIYRKGPVVGLEVESILIDQAVVVQETEGSLRIEIVLVCHRLARLGLEKQLEWRGNGDGVVCNAIVQCTAQYDRRTE